MSEIERAIEKKEYIERGALIAFVREVRKKLPKDSKDFFTRDEMLLNFQQYLESQKAADVSPVVHGEWIESEWRPKCSVCGHTGSIFDSPTSPFNFCPNCGAHMMDETKLRPAIIEQIPTARLRELAEAEREGRILILWKPIEENDGMFTVLYRRHDGMLMGRTDHTAEEAVKNATADYARAEQAEAREKAAVADMKLIADNVRETHCDDTCCFTCKHDCDMSINDSGEFNNECPGFDRDDCFEWRGAREGEGK